MKATKVAEGLPDRDERVDRQKRSRAAWRTLSFRNIGAVYVWIAIVVIFAIWVPSTFPTMATVREVLDSYAITALLALSLVVPLSARVFDLSVGYTASLTGVLAAFFIAHGVGDVLAIVIAMSAAVVIGLANATVVVVFRVDSFIATLATGSIIDACETWVTHGGLSIESPRVAGSFTDIAQSRFAAGLTLPVLYMLIVAVALWLLQSYTVTGRQIYATGFNYDSARLAGVKVDRLRVASLMISALIAGAAGIVLAATIGAGQPGVGEPYLLSAFAAAFLGATQLTPGRFNAWGTLVAILMLGTGITGLGLASAPQWTTEVFTGVVLIAALAITGSERRALGTHRFRRRGGDSATSVLPLAIERIMGKARLSRLRGKR